MYINNFDFAPHENYSKLMVHKCIYHSIHMGL